MLPNCDGCITSQYSFSGDRLWINSVERKDRPIDDFDWSDDLLSWPSISSPPEWSNTTPCVKTMLQKQPKCLKPNTLEIHLHNSPGFAYVFGQIGDAFLRIRIFLSAGRSILNRAITMNKCHDEFIVAYNYKKGTNLRQTCGVAGNIVLQLSQKCMDGLTASVCRRTALVVP